MPISDFNKTVDRNLARAQAAFDAMEPEDEDEEQDRAARQQWRDEQAIEDYISERG